MDSKDALVLDNYFPTTEDAVSSRGQHDQWSTGMTGAVETVIDYSKGATNEMWAFAANKIYNVSLTTGAVGAAAVSGLTNNRWQYTIFTTSGDTRIVTVNGAMICANTTVQSGRLSDAGSAPIAITGVAHFDLHQRVAVHHVALFFVQKNTMKAWYLPVDQFGGAALSIDLGTLFKKGGYFVAGASWTRDGGDGMDDLCVFISSLGEVAIYTGNDPAVAANWELFGRYEVAPPIGYRCLIKTGADLAIISIDGILGLSSIISLDRAASNKVALSNKIRRCVS
jgi:hypothetical protein